MHRHCRFPGARHPLHDHIVIGRFPDDFVLFLLDGRYDLTEYRLLVSGKVFGQQIIIGNHLRIKIVKELSFFNLVGTLQLQINGKLLPVGRRITAFSQPIFIICVGNRRTPINDHLVCCIFCNPASSDIQ